MSKNITISALFQNAQEEGTLSPASVQALNVVDIGQEIQAALGVEVDDVTASEVVLVTIMPDDSGSIEEAGNAQAVRDGYNLVLQALKDSKQKEGILVHNRYLNGFILDPYCFLDQAKEMNAKNYDPSLGTPLYDQSVILLGTVLAKSQEFANNGVPVRTVTLIITDGEDLHSKRHNAKKVASIVKDMLATENHIIAAMGVDNGRTNFKEIFEKMGIREEWILTPKNTPSEIHKAFRVFSQSAVRASQSAKSFSQTAMGGFGN